MKKKLESIINKAKIIALAVPMIFMPLRLDSHPIKHHVEPRVGTITPVMAQVQDYNSFFSIGGAYGLDFGKIGLEAGLDYFNSSGEYIKTNSLLPRFNISYSPLNPEAKVKPYVMAGVNLLNEFSTINIPEFDIHDKVSNTTFGLEGGIGTTIADKFNARLSYTQMPKSENVKGMIALTFGYRFGFGKKK